MSRRINWIDVVLGLQKGRNIFDSIAGKSNEVDGYGSGKTKVDIWDEE